jgi:hypothetical protein
MLPGGMCYLSDGVYRPAVLERIASKRLARAWQSAIGAIDPLDVEW